MSSPTIVILAAGRARRYGGVKQLAPVGPHGEAVIDLVAGDAVAGGFDRVVLVVNPDTGPLIREHVAASWPSGVSVGFAIQERPLGTVHAVLSAVEEVDTQSAFAVCNADDLYGRRAMALLGGHLTTRGDNCLVGYRLDRALVGDDPVTRGVCRIESGRLAGIVERRKVHRVNGRFLSDDGLEPRELAPETRVSMNLWGFEPSMWRRFADAMERAVGASEDAEVLLPDLVGECLSEQGVTFTVLDVDDECLGVTHPGDLPIVQAQVRDQVARGERPGTAFSAMG